MLAVEDRSNNRLKTCHAFSDIFIFAGTTQFKHPLMFHLFLVSMVDQWILTDGHHFLLWFCNNFGEDIKQLNHV